MSELLSHPIGISPAIPRPGRLVEIVATRMRRPGIEPGTTATLLEGYGLHRTGRVRNLPFGWRHRTVVVPTSGGPKVLKRYRDGWPSPTIAHEHSLLDHLRAEGFPAVHLVRTTTGDTLLEHDGGRFVMSDYEEGKNLAGSLLPRGRRTRLWVDAGRLLARFHDAVDGFTPRGHHHLGFVDMTGDRTRDLAWHLHALEELARDPGHVSTADAEADLRWMVENADRIGARISELERALSGTPLARTTIHGDYGIHNLLLKRDGTGVVHDLELARLEWRLVDLVIVLARLDPPLGRAFLQGYDAAAGPRSEDRRPLGNVWQHYRLCGAVQSWSTFARSGDDRRIGKARARVEEADRIATTDNAMWGGRR